APTSMPAADLPLAAPSHAASAPVQRSVESAVESLETFHPAPMTQASLAPRAIPAETPADTPVPPSEPDPEPAADAPPMTVSRLASGDHEPAAPAPETTAPILGQSPPVPRRLGLGAPLEPPPDEPASPSLPAAFDFAGSETMTFGP